MNEQTNIDTDLRLQNDAELLAKLVGKTVVHLSNEWCAERVKFRKFYSIRRISSVELELEPHKAIVMRFCDESKPIMFLNLDQFDNYFCKIDDYGSIKEYLEDNGFSAF